MNIKMNKKTFPVITALSSLFLVSTATLAAGIAENLPLEKTPSSYSRSFTPRIDISPTKVTLTLEEASPSHDEGKRSYNERIYRSPTPKTGLVLAPYYENILYNIVNVGHRAQRLMFENYGTEWSKEIIGESRSDRINGVGALFQITGSFSNSGFSHYIVNAGGTKQYFYFKDTTLDWGMYGSSKSSERTLFAIEPDGNKYTLRGQTATGKKEYLYFRDRNNDWTWLDRHSTHSGGKEGYLFDFIPAYTRKNEYYKIFSQVVDKRDSEYGKPINSPLKELYKSPIYTHGYISIDPYQLEQYVERTLTFNKSDTHKVSYNAGVELQVGYAAGESGGPEASLKTSYTYGEEFITAVDKGASFKSSSKATVRIPINGFTVPTGKQARYTIIETQGIASIPFTAKMKYTAQAIQLPIETSIERYSHYKSVNDVLVAHFLVVGENLNIGDLMKAGDSRTIIADITGTTLQRENGIDVIYEKADLGKDNWEQFSPLARSRL